MYDQTDGSRPNPVPRRTAQSVVVSVVVRVVLFRVTPFCLVVPCRASIPSIPLHFILISSLPAVAASPLLSCIHFLFSLKGHRDSGLWQDPCPSEPSRLRTFALTTVGRRTDGNVLFRGQRPIGGEIKKPSAVRRLRAYLLICRVSLTTDVSMSGNATTRGRHAFSHPIYLVLLAVYTVLSVTSTDDKKRR
ncbi:hypothetical protein BJV78DRAFT_233923 [Lactifluus subvellereus]|nr:hypothetical protein BJV78DRAFT_233923 [Lactifluus subvellereus]